MDRRIVIGTANRHKFAEIEKILCPEDIGVELFFGGDLVSESPLETGTDFLENALIKARFYCEHTEIPTIADDSGLMVEALQGAPGVFSARYAGQNCSYDDNNRKLLRQLERIPPDRRKAKFVCVAVLYLPDGRDFVATGTLEGKIATAPRGNGGFGYDPIFELPDGRTVAEISAVEKNQISHRAKAFMQMRGIISILFGMPS